MLPKLLGTSFEAVDPEGHCHCSGTSTDVYVAVMYDSMPWAERKIKGPQVPLVIGYEPRFQLFTTVQVGCWA